MQSQTPTTIITGFLGSGKTTIITHLVEQLRAQDIQVVYIKNELGEEDLDTKIIASKNIKTKELLNGCICCTLVGPFQHAIEEIISTYHPERIIIEASGAADSSALALMVDAHPLIKRDGILSVIDVTNFEGYKDLSVTAKNQTKFTDLLVFNKVELADLEQKKRVVGYVRELNDHSPIVEAKKGKIDVDLVFGLSNAQLETLLQAEKTMQDTEHHTHLNDDNLHAVNLRFDNSVHFDAQLFTQALRHLPDAVFRSKGVVQTTQGPHVFNGVAHRVTLEPYAGTTNETICIFIGSGIELLKEQLQTELKNAQSS